jgi:hypothetical protein
MKPLNAKTLALFEQEVKGLLHASRDCMRNQGLDTKAIQFSVFDTYYCEAYGMFRTLRLINGNPNIINQHFARLQREVLEEENFGGSGKCEYCKTRWGKDDAS